MQRAQAWKRLQIRAAVIPVSYTHLDRERLPEASPNPAISNTGVIRTFHKPSGFDDILSQEYDGQISLAIPEEEQIEKQITGQLSIDDVMAEWEKMKKENEQKMMQEIKERVHKQTDSLFSDFDEATKTGLLEELEKAMVDAAVRASKKRAEAERPKVVKVSDIDAKEEEKAEEQPEEQTEKQPEEQTEVIEDAEIIEEETGEADTSLDEEIPAEEVPEKEIAEEEAAEEKIEEEKTKEEKTKEEGTAEACLLYTSVLAAAPDRGYCFAAQSHIQKPLTKGRFLQASNMALYHKACSSGAASPRMHQSLGTRKEPLVDMQPHSAKKKGLLNFFTTFSIRSS